MIHHYIVIRGERTRPSLNAGAFVLKEYTKKSHKIEYDQI